MPKFIVTTTSTFMHKYAFEANSIEEIREGWDKNETDMDMAEILSKHIGEDIVEIREATDDDIVAEAEEYMRGFVLGRIPKFEVAK